jgi:hypothetical protein
VDIPSKLPAPDFGTAAQPGPNGWFIAAAAEVAGEDGMEVVAEADGPLPAFEEESLLLLEQAVTASGSTDAAAAATSRRRVEKARMVNSVRGEGVDRERGERGERVTV